MAIINLKDVEVVRVNQNGFGLQVVEKFEVQGKERQKRYNIWFDQDSGLREGDIVSISGLYSSKVSSWKDRNGEQRHSVESSVNQPKIDSRVPRQESTNDGWGQPQQESNWGQQAQSWGSPAPNTQTEPF